MAQQKKPPAKKPAKKPTLLSLEEAADLLGMTPDALMMTRGRGMEPGTAGYKQDGSLVFTRGSLEAWLDKQAHVEEEQ